MRIKIQPIDLDENIKVISDQTVTLGVTNVEQF